MVISTPLHARDEISDEMLQHPYFFLGQGPVHASGKVLFRESCIIRPVKLDHLIAEVFKYAADQPVPAGVDFDLNVSFVFTFDKMKAVGTDLAIFKGNAGPYLFQITKRQVFVKRHMVHFGHFVAGM